MKAFITLFIAAIIAGCTPNYEPADQVFPTRPKALEDCTITRLSGTSGQVLYVTRCPRSDTTTSVTDKNPRHFTVSEE